MNAYDTITQHIIAQLEQGTVPWRCPWRTQSLPKNLFSQKTYRGINVWLLISRPYASPYWLTYRQAQEIGGWVRAGEKGTPVVFWKFDRAQHEDIDPDATLTRRPPLLRTYSVFNVEQCELPASVTARLAIPVEREHELLTACEQLVTQMPNPPVILHDAPTASYSPRTDTVQMPSWSRFVITEEYFSTLYHELCHASGHGCRLARSGITNEAAFASHVYSLEELVAECGAAFLCGISGIAPQTIENTVAYSAYWLAQLRADRTLLIRAASQAQHAVDYICGVATAA